MTRNVFAHVCPLLIVIGLPLSTLGCSSADSPTSPSGPISVEGVWRGTAQVATVEGGACLRTTWGLTLTLDSTFTFLVNQDGAMLTGTTEADDRGLPQCQLRGTLNGTTYEFDLIDCVLFLSRMLFTSCFDGTQVGVRFVDASVRGTVSADRRSTGTLTETFDVEDRQGQLLERMVATSALDISLPPR